VTDEDTQRGRGEIDIFSPGWLRRVIQSVEPDDARQSEPRRQPQVKSAPRGRRIGLAPTLQLAFKLGTASMAIRL
jgi:hypothetical protein